jgi:FKBP-type peptidyl-prolyl cis-trans isomerase FklB
VSRFIVINKITLPLWKNNMREASQDDNPPIPPDAIRCISGLIYQVLKPGAGNERPGPDDVVQVVYRARTARGHLLDTSGDTSKTLSVRGAMPGLAEALQLMTVGQKMRVWMPPTPSTDKPREVKNWTVVFDIELVGFTRMKEYSSLPTELTSPRKEE